MDMTPQTWPEWYDGRHINEVLFCQQFLDTHPMKCVRGRLFTVDGLIEDEGQIGNLILEEISGVLTSGLSKVVTNLLASIKLQAYSPPLPIETDRIHVANGTYGSGLSIGGIERRLAELETQFQHLLEQAADNPAAYSEQFKTILDEQTSLKGRRAAICAEDKAQAETARRIERAAEVMQSASPHLTEWNETIIRQLVEQVKVLSKDEIEVRLKNGTEIRQCVAKE